MINSKLFKLSISSIVLFLIGYSIDWQSLNKININITTIDLIIIISLLTSSLFLRIYRWHMLINSKSFVIDLIGSIQLFFIGQSLNIILPAGAGDVAKGYYGYKITGIKEKMFAISLVDKLIAIGSILFITPFASYYFHNYTIIFAGVLSMLPFFILYQFDTLKKYDIFNIPYNYLSKKIKKINLPLLITYSKIAPKKILFAFSLSIIAWIVTYILLYFCFKIVGLSIDIKIVICSIPLLTLARLFPFTLNGIGSDEALIIFLFATNELSREPILIAALLYRLILMFLPALVGLLFIFKNNK